MTILAELSTQRIEFIKRFLNKPVLKFLTPEGASGYDIYIVHVPAERKKYAFAFKSKCKSISCLRAIQPYNEKITKDKILVNIVNDLDQNKIDTKYVEKIINEEEKQYLEKINSGPRKYELDRSVSYGQYKTLLNIDKMIKKLAKQKKIKIIKYSGIGEIDDEDHYLYITFITSMPHKEVKKLFGRWDQFIPFLAPQTYRKWITPV